MKFDTHDAIKHNKFYYSRQHILHVSVILTFLRLYIHDFKTQNKMHVYTF